MTAVKGFELAIEAVAELAQQGIATQLVLVGDGPERQRLEDLAHSLAVRQRVHLVGHHSEVGPWLVAMDIFLNTSHSEGMSQSLVEAMSKGLPLVVTDVGDNCVLAGGELECGVVVPRRSGRAMAKSIAALLNHGGELARLRRNAGEKYRRSYGLAEMIASYELLYQTEFDEVNASTQR